MISPFAASGASRTAARNGWIDDFATGDDFGTFLEEQNDRVASTLEELGLA